MKLLFCRFVGPITAVYLLHWGIWDLVLMCEQIIMSALTRSFNWLADLVRAGHIETAYWSVRWVAPEAFSEGLLPITLGLFIGCWVLRKRQRHPSR
jgi:hypothetical protein